MCDQIMLPHVTRYCRVLARRMASSSARPEPLLQVPKVNQFGIPLLPEGLREKLFARQGPNSIEKQIWLEFWLEMHPV